MKVKNITDVEKFFKVIDECKGKVELVTDEGDRLNLKSKLTQYVALSGVFKDNTIGEMELIAHEPEDVHVRRRSLRKASSIWERIGS